jgi:hypothetical protein
MRRGLFAIGAVGWAVLLASSVATAHHFFPHDSDKPVLIVGSVTKFEWVNPHAYLYLDVKDTDGAVSNWQIELGSPFALLRRGWQKESVKFGDLLRVEGYLSVTEAKKAIARDIQLPDGRKMFAGSHVADPVP